ncbi:MAG: HpcH/HpaI aldolase/citrate lyase family protein [Lachnospiraceae bacterium]|nr:HpcH/HpaI aldolase/citrate lyase family protein [Lachnospiraceae bacterium]
MKDLSIYYTVGALLYCPANNESIAKSIIQERFGNKYSLALCLEDTIKDDCVQEAECKLITALQCIHEASLSQNFYIPKIFIRVRNPEQIPLLFDQLEAASTLITGFIIPKFALDNADAYIGAIEKLNNISNNPVYMMPIFESPTIIHLQHRAHILYALKEKLDTIAPYVLNIRVGGNDLCHTFGFRRQKDESIHSIKPIDNIFSDIITVFGMDYVVSGPVWEYYSGDGWDTGLANELKEDQLCGFLGKTAIHPNQIAIINEAYKVSRNDYEDAKAILNWSEESNKLVSGSSSRERMNEYKTHHNWARKILFMAEYYGIK